MSRTEVAKQKVRAAASELLHDSGVPAFTVDEVARRSGVAKTTIYRHWPSGDALLVDTVACHIQELPTPNTGSLRRDLEAFFELILPAGDQGRRARMMFGLLYAAADDPNLRSALDDMLRARSTPVRTMIELAMARGEVRADLDLDLAVDLVHGPLVHRFMLRNVPFERADAEALLDLVVAALAPR